MRFVAKALACAMASLVSWMATSAIMAQYPRKAASAAPPAPATAVKVASGAEPAEFAPATTSHPSSVASMRMRSFDVTINGGRAIVRGVASMADKRPGMAYIWRLKVDDAAGVQLAGRIYIEQAFSMEDDGQMEPKFADEVSIVGARRISLSLYAIPPGRDASIFDDEDQAKDALVIRSVKLLKH